ncbi:MAG: ATP-binding cassette domain-containing protein, partial [Pseudoflavonifractor sp.]
MVGRKVDLSFTRRSECAGEVGFSVSNLNLTERGVPVLRNVAFQVRKGHILGIAGIEGNGQTELIEVLTGLRKPDSMTLLKDGKPLAGNAAQFLSAGVGHIPEDRLTRGLITPMTIEDNIILGYHRLSRFSGKGIRKQSAIRSFAKEKSAEFNVKTPNVDERCSSLSGGNQQKVIIARVFSEDPDVLIAAQPTRGVDVGAQEFIHNRLLDLRDEGKAIILISADLDEVRRLSDRVAVIYDGTLVAESEHDVWDEMELGLLMTGSRSGEVTTA